MPAKWTGDFVREVHMSGVTIKAVAEKAGLNDKYVSQVLHADNPPDKARDKLFTALGELVKTEEREKMFYKGTEINTPTDERSLDKLLELTRAVFVANALQHEWQYSLTYRFGLFVHVKRWPISLLISQKIVPPGSVDVTDIDVRMDDLDALDAAIRAVKDDLRAFIQDNDVNTEEVTEDAEAENTQERGGSSYRCHPREVSHALRGADRALQADGVQHGNGVRANQKPRQHYYP